MCAGDEFEMVYPARGETLVVNDSMGSALVENGCLICGTKLTGDAFRCL
jgi:hypothetical protein